jgi:hypothetical protein
MQQSYPLDKAIKKVSKSFANLLPNQKLVTINKETGKVHRQNFLGGLFPANVECYLITIDTEVGDSFTYNHKLIDVGNFSLIVEYEISIKIEDAEKVAEALCLETHPGVRLEQNIQKHIKDSIRENRKEFLENFPQWLITFRTALIGKVETDTSLTIEDIQISLDESKLKPFLIESQHFPVLVKDYDGELDLEIRVELVTDSRNKIKAISNYEKRSNLSDFVRSEINHYLSKNVLLQSFYYDLKTTVYQGLKGHLDSVLVSQGLKIQFFSIGTNEIAPVRLSEIEESVICKVQEYSEPVIIKNRLQMIPSDVSKYRTAGSPPLKEWVKDQLGTIIPQELFDKSIDILFDFEKPESSSRENIKKLMKLEAAKIGYSINQLVSIVELKFDSLTKDFDLTDEGVFSLKSSSGRLEVKLNVIVSMKIEKLEKIKKYLKNDISVDEFKGLIKSKIHSAVSQHLHKVEPDRYYLRFDFEDDPQLSQKTVEEELKDAIKKVLEDFSATVRDVVLERLDTEISERFKCLYQQGVGFQLDVQSKLDYGETVKFTGYLQVSSVSPDNWHVFQYRLPNLTSVKDFMLDTLQQKLEEKYNTDELRYMDNTSLQEQVTQWATTIIIEQFGLEVEIKNWKRPRTENEESLAEVEKAIHKNKISGTKTKLDILDIQNRNKLEAAQLASENKLQRQSQLYENRDELEFLDEAKIAEEIGGIEKESIDFSIKDAEDDLEELKKSMSKPLGSNKIRGAAQQESPSIIESKDQNLLETTEEKDRC